MQIQGSSHFDNFPEQIQHPPLKVQEQISEVYLI